ncbi:uncharacterized protein B0H18DRAFT_1215581 [Fomitopsis serialis]|uniref:uncharacterized protein n=1 Tax=Fomitopsis serialis TaxID=139415 RepID=UPI00200764FE|nr:uncharacterized protein B0H18DRAFT_1215581 [Neoantrodia serialis]KAH9915337.1 hypothetical protein B0H18DRAFT_1215581 [Neoantrodia serialis]
MPGPRNMKKKAKQQAKKARYSQGERPLDDEQDASSKSPAPVACADEHDALCATGNTQLVTEGAYQYNQPIAANALPPDHPYYPAEAYPNPYSAPDPYEEPPPPNVPEDHERIHPSLVNEPFIYDPGNGPRVRNVHAFLDSTFASPPSLDDPLCAEFAQEEMLEMLCSVLPEETALILWYNKSRQVARVCPACQRLYHLGDVLPEHLLDENSIPKPHEPIAPNLFREQELSGLCSPMCFVLAAFNYPGVIRSAWGRMAEELDAETWDLLDGPGMSAVQNDRGLGMLLKMTRCTDLGLGEMFFPDEELVVEEDYGNEGYEEYSDEEDYGLEVSLSDSERLVGTARWDRGSDETQHQLEEDGLLRSMNVLSLTA